MSSLAARSAGQMHEVAKQRPVVAVEEHFQLSDIAGPDLLHDLFVFHVPPFT